MPTPPTVTAPAVPTMAKSCESRLGMSTPCSLTCSGCADGSPHFKWTLVLGPFEPSMRRAVNRSAPAGDRRITNGQKSTLRPNRNMARLDPKTARGLPAIRAEIRAFCPNRARTSGYPDGMVFRQALFLGAVALTARSGARYCAGDGAGEPLTVACSMTSRLVAHRPPSSRVGSDPSATRAREILQDLSVRACQRVPMQCLRQAAIIQTCLPTTELQRARKPRPEPRH